MLEKKNNIWHFDFIFSLVYQQRGRFQDPKNKTLKYLYFFRYFSLFSFWNIYKDLYNFIIFCFFFKDKNKFFSFLFLQYKMVASSFKKFINLFFQANEFLLNTFFSEHIFNFILKIRISKTNIFFTLLESLTLKTLFKISGGFSYNYGIEANKEKAKKKKAKYKVSFKPKKKRKDFKKTSSFSLNYMLEKVSFFLLKKGFSFLNIFFWGNTKHPFFRLIYFFFLNKSKKIKISSFSLKTFLSFNGVRKKKVRRI